MVLTLTNYVVKPPQPDVTVRPFSSAGVFDSTGKMVRNLWSAMTNDPRVSNPAGAWDGLMDDGNIAPTGTYTVKLLRHNLQYLWEGVIYNSTPHADHIYKLFYHNGSALFVDMDISDAGEMFYSTSYDERWMVWKWLQLSDPQHMSGLLWAEWAFRITETNITCQATDGILCYCAHMPQGGANGDVIAGRCSEKAKYNG